VVDSCERGNETSGSIKVREFLDRQYQQKRLFLGYKYGYFVTYYPIYRGTVSDAAQASSFTPSCLCGLNCD
jgi:hypothetical protein